MNKTQQIQEVLSNHEWKQEHFTGFYHSSYWDNKKRIQVFIKGYRWGFRLKLDQLMKNYQMQLDWRNHYFEKGDTTTVNKVDRTIFSLERLILEEIEKNSVKLNIN
jgi:hypothetical protein